MKKIKAYIKLRCDKGKLHFQAIKGNCEIGKCGYLRNSQYIKLGDRVKMKDNFRIECYDNFAGEPLSPNMYIGDGAIISYNFTAFVADDLFIGRDTIIAANTMITTENHGYNPEIPVPYHRQPLTTAPVRVGENCWVGEKVMILPGVTIGNGCVIAAGAVVTKDVPDYCIAAGVPAKIIKQYDFVLHRWCT